MIEDGASIKHAALFLTEVLFVIIFISFNVTIPSIDFILLILSKIPIIILFKFICRIPFRFHINRIFSNTYPMTTIKSIRIKCRMIFTMINAFITKCWM